MKDLTFFLLLLMNYISNQKICEPIVSVCFSQEVDNDLVGIYRYVFLNLKKSDS